MPSVLIADDHPLFRAALNQSVHAALPEAEIAEASDLPSTMARLADAPDTDMILLDLHMPGSLGVSGLARVRGQFPAVAVLVVSAHDDARIVRRVLDHGAAGFVSKGAPSTEIAAAVRCVLDGDEWIPPHLAAQVAALPIDTHERTLARHLAQLTEQQHRVLALVAIGLLNKQIADRLGIQERTVKAHLSAIFERLGVRNRTQASGLLRALDDIDMQRGGMDALDEARADD
ncbi:MAG: response regulator transcription factor [Proteobacteria bacterium]|nr:response regulator transcription factor [Pseudomonadota bacterium]